MHWVRIIRAKVSVLAQHVLLLLLLLLLLKSHSTVLIWKWWVRSPLHSVWFQLASHERARSRSRPGKSTVDIRALHTEGLIHRHVPVHTIHTRTRTVPTISIIPLKLILGMSSGTSVEVQVLFWELIIGEVVVDGRSEIHWTGRI